MSGPSSNPEWHLPSSHVCECVRVTINVKVVYFTYAVSVLLPTFRHVCALSMQAADLRRCATGCT